MDCHNRCGEGTKREEDIDRVKVSIDKLIGYRRKELILNFINSHNVLFSISVKENS